MNRAQRATRQALIGKVAGLINRPAVSRSFGPTALVGNSLQDTIRAQKNVRRRRKGKPLVQEDFNPNGY